jgi:hypothetical protein
VRLIAELPVFRQFMGDEPVARDAEMKQGPQCPSTKRRSRVAFPLESEHRVWPASDDIVDAREMDAEKQFDRGR